MMSGESSSAYCLAQLMNRMIIVIGIHAAQQEWQGSDDMPHRLSASEAATCDVQTVNRSRWHLDVTKKEAERIGRRASEA